VTLEVMGEGWSMGPLNPQMRRLQASRQGDIHYPVTWTTLGDYLDFMQRRGIAPNIASFVGATVGVPLATTARAVPIKAAPFAGTMSEPVAVAPVVASVKFDVLTV